MTIAGGGGGGQFCQSGILTTSTSTRYFYKSGISPSDAVMLRGEYEGVKAMSETNTIKVPKPFIFQPSPLPFVVFEYLDLSGGGDEHLKGSQLALMHRSTSPNSKFGFRVPNTIGSTPQTNTWESSWSDFYVKHRFLAILSKCGNLGYAKEDVNEVASVIHTELSSHSPPPSLLHGDLWGGNSGYTSGSPVIYDPACYYGDREADLAMTYLFGGYGKRFYEGYEEEWPVGEGFQER